MQFACRKFVAGLLLAVFGVLSLCAPALRSMHLHQVAGVGVGCGHAPRDSHGSSPACGGPGADVFLENGVLADGAASAAHDEHCAICHYFAQVQLVHSDPAVLLTAVLSLAQAKYPAPSRASRFVEPYFARGPPATI